MNLDPRFAKRLVPARPDLADASLQGKVEAERFVEPAIYQVQFPVLDVFAEAEIEHLTTQLLLGERFAVLETREDIAWGYAMRDGYVGYVPAAGLGPVTETTHEVTARSSHAYPEPSFKTIPTAALPFGARLQVVEAKARFCETGIGHVPEPHISALKHDDFVTVAELFLGAPYLWGGRSSFGLDCSALVQLSLEAVGRTAPRDSDMQEALLGEAMSSGDKLHRGDLVFWKGHVGIMQSENTLLHANAGAMSVALEDLDEAEARILAGGDGPITARRRLD